VTALSQDAQFLAAHGPETLVQIMVAVSCGALLGYERQRKAKPVGILTSILVALGSTLFVLTATLLMDPDSSTADPTRMPSMIVSGIGFIGAGAILRSRISVSGLASAATIWSKVAIHMIPGLAGHLVFGAIMGACYGALCRGSVEP